MKPPTFTARVKIGEDFHERSGPMPESIARAIENWVLAGLYGDGPLPQGRQIEFAETEEGKEPK